MVYVSDLFFWCESISISPELNWDRGVNNGPDDDSIDLSSIVVKLPLSESELVRLLPQRLAIGLRVLAPVSGYTSRGKER